MTVAAVASAGYAAGCLLIVCGLLVLFGLGLALIAAGVLLAGSCLLVLLVDTDESADTARNA